MSFLVVLDGGPFDGIEHEMQRPARHIDVRRVCRDPEHNVPMARYFPTAGLDRGGRLIYRYEAP